jgi:hypothetical protein
MLDLPVDAAPGNRQDGWRRMPNRASAATIPPLTAKAIPRFRLEALAPAPVLGNWLTVPVVDTAVGAGPTGVLVGTLTGEQLLSMQTLPAEQRASGSASAEQHSTARHWDPQQIPFRHWESLVQTNPSG